MRPAEAIPPVATVRVEVPRGAFLKRDAAGRIEFVSPLPCPFDYGSVAGVEGGDGDAQDAVVLGPSTGRGLRAEVPVRGCVRFVDAGFPDDKWVCASEPLTAGQERAVIGFFRFYGLVKRVHDRLRGERAPTGYRGYVRLP